MNYVPLAAGIITNESAGTQGELNAGTSTQKEEISQDCIVMPIWKDASYFDSPSNDVGNGEPKSAADDLNTKVTTGHFKLNTVDPSVNTASSSNPDSPKDMFTMGASHTLEATHVEFFSDEDEPEVDLGNILNSYTIPTTPNTRIHKDHPIKNMIGDVKSYVQTRRMTKPTSEQGLNPQALLKLYLIHIVWKQCMKNFCNSNSNRFRNLWICLTGKGPLEQNRIEAIRLFLAYASFMGFLVYQMDVKSAFLYGTIEEEFYVTQPPEFKDPEHPDKVYKELCTAFEKLMKDKFQMSSMGELTFFLGLQVQQKEDRIFISHDKYVAEILKKFNYTYVKSASTPVDLEKPLVKDGDADDVDVHLYRSMIGSFMYLTASRLDIMFAVCACGGFQVTPKISHLLVIKRIFRYLKGKPTLGFWYSRDYPFELVAYIDSDYAGATQDRKSTTGDLLTKGFDAGRHVKRGRDTKIPQSSGPPIKVGDEAVHKELGDRMERAATTASSLEAEQDSGYRKKKWGMNENEGFRALFILKWNLEAKES
ncbi:putative ribonuclease H-like domain-containing protein [Tanacetum coccineum]